MRLPPLPRELARFTETQALHRGLNDMVQAYGQACRETALEEAAQACAQLSNSKENTADYRNGAIWCAERIKGLK